MNYAEHPEELDGYDLITADFLAALERHVDRETGVDAGLHAGQRRLARRGRYEGHFPEGRITLLEDGTYKA